MNLNSVIIVGRVTADPVLKSTNSGKQVTSFGVATNRTWKNKDGQKQEEVEFHNIVAWGRTAEIATKYLVKGSLVLIEGRLATRTWDDKEGNKRKQTEVIVERIQLGPRPAAKNGGAPAADEIPEVELGENTGREDLPF